MNKTDSLIVSFNGQEGSGKSTIAKLVAEKLNCPRFYMGQMFRDMAAERGMSLPELRKLCDLDPDFDRKVDDFLIKLSTEHAHFIIESRTAWHFIPESIKIFLKVDSLAAAERIFKALKTENNRENEDKNLDSIENIETSILKRRKEDSERYFTFYGIHQDDEKNYDLVVDTTNRSIEEVFTLVMEFITAKNDEKKLN